MKMPSRLMPAAPTAEMTIGGWIILASMATALIPGLFVSEGLRWGVGVCAILFSIVTVIHHLRDRRLRKERNNESICSFVRALPMRDRDTWVVRAVYEEFLSAAKFPIRPTDEVEKLLGIVGEDLDDIAVKIARRAMRSMDETNRNPMFGRIITVADVIEFLENQPKLPNQSGADHRRDRSFTQKGS